MRYYYKSKSGNGFLNLLKPCEDENYIEITKNEFIELTTPKNEEINYTAEKLAEIEKQNKITEYKNYLSDTDYITSKLTEALADGDTEEVENLKSTYAEQLAKRKEYRKLLNEMKG